MYIIEKSTGEMKQSCLRIFTALWHVPMLYPMYSFFVLFDNTVWAKWFFSSDTQPCRVDHMVTVNSVHLCDQNINLRKHFSKGQSGLRSVTVLVVFIEMM